MRLGGEDGIVVVVDKREGGGRERERGADDPIHLSLWQGDSSR